MLKVTGYSDDAIVTEGDLNGQFDWYAKDSETGYLSFSDGTLLRALYDNDGIWRLQLVAKGSLYDSKEEGSVEEDTFDIVKFKDGIQWCMFGEYYTIKRK